jgi:hypothetical protein
MANNKKLTKEQIKAAKDAELAKKAKVNLKKNSQAKVDASKKDLLGKPPIADEDIISPDQSSQPKVYDLTSQVDPGGLKLYNKKIMSTSYTTKDTKQTISGKPTQQSIFNNFALFRFNGTPFTEDTGSNIDSYNTVDFGDKDLYENPTVSKIISKCNASEKHKSYKYEWSDFALCKYLGKIPNNHMITLRRFSFPIGDDIMHIKMTDKGGALIDVAQPDIARAVTWMSEATGNQLEEILKFDYNYKWKPVEADIQVLDSQTQAKRGKLGSFIDNSTILSALNATANGVNAAEKRRIESAGAGFDAFKETYPNHVYGPYNSIRSMIVRDGGMEFNQSFTLKFQYEMRAIGDANPKALFLDQFANILALTYSNAPFWGGEVRYTNSGEGSIGRPLGDISKLTSGDYGGFFKSVLGDLKGLAGGGTMAGITSLLGKTANNLLGGALMDLFNSPQGGQVANAFLTGEPTGAWHVTIGNPLNPIAVIGNLICEKSEVQFKGPLGPLDFPENLEVSITLKPGRPRDKSEIESMFNAGRGRFFITPADGPDTNKEKIAGTAVGDATHTSAPNLRNTKSGIKMTDREFDEYKKLANG